MNTRLFRRCICSGSSAHSAIAASVPGEFGESSMLCSKSLLPGEVFRVEGRTAFVIPPDRKTSDGATPWVWYAPTLPNLPGTEERWMFERFTKAGIANAK